jgi:hypothetical protein
MISVNAQDISAANLTVPPNGDLTTEVASVFHGGSQLSDTCAGVVFEKAVTLVGAAQ